MNSIEEIASALETNGAGGVIISNGVTDKENEGDSFEESHFIYV